MSNEVKIEENEKYGPKVGVKINKDQAEQILKRHFPDLSVSSIFHIDRGYNNRVYIITASNKDEYILRLSGRFWTRYKTENEVAALIYLKNRCESLPVPRIFGYCTNKELSGINAEYILMEKIKGEPLENIWKDLDLESKYDIMDQVSHYVSNLQAIRFSESGSFQFTPEVAALQGIGVNPEEINPEKSIRVGRGVEFDGGPFTTFIEFIRSTSETEIMELKKCEFMHDSENYNERVQRIKNFVAAFASYETLPRGIEREDLENVPFVFTHGDLEPRNIMVDKEANRITGILDWEFAGSYPIDEDWIASFGFVEGDTSDWRALNMERPELKSTDEHPSDPEMANLLRKEFFTKVRREGGSVPDDMPGHMIRAELYYFRGYICPWWLREKIDPIPECNYGSRKHTCEKVDNILEKYGF